MERTNNNVAPPRQGLSRVISMVMAATISRLVRIFRKAGGEGGDHGKHQRKQRRALNTVIRGTNPKPKKEECEKDEKEVCGLRQLHLGFAGICQGAAYEDDECRKQKRHYGQTRQPRLMITVDPAKKVNVTEDEQKGIQAIGR